MQKTVKTERPKPNPGDLRDKVREWVSREGYPFELRVGSQLRAAGFHNVMHGRYYRDRETNKWREIDIIAYRFSKAVFPQSGGPALGPNLGIQLIVECKHGSRPWVVLASKADDHELQFPSTFLLGRAAKAVLRQAEMPNITPTSQGGSGVRLTTLSFDKVRGHNIVQTSNLSGKSNSQRTEGINAAYSAIRSVIAAAGAIADRSDAVRREIGPERQFSGAVIVLPVIVCNAPIFRLTLSSAGVEELEEVEDISVGAPPHESTGGLTLVRIVRPGKPLQIMAKSATEDVERIAAMLRGNWSEHSKRASQLMGEAPV